MGPKAEEEADKKSQKEDPAKLKKTGNDTQIQGCQRTYTSVPSLVNTSAIDVQFWPCCI